MLGRLRFRTKLTLVVALPLLAVALLTLPGVLGAIERAERAREIERTMLVANQVSSLVSDLRQERLLSLGHLLGVVERSRLVGQSTRVTDRIVDIQHDAAAGELGGALPERVVAALQTAAALADIRQPVLDRQVGPDQVIGRFGLVSDQLIDSLRLFDGVDLANPAARQVAALDAALRSSESASRATDMLLLTVATNRPETMAGYLTSLQLVGVHLARFSEYASPEQIALIDIMAQAYTARGAIGTDLQLVAEPGQPLVPGSVLTVFPSLESLGQLGRFVEKKVINDVLLEVEAAGQAELGTAYLVGFGALLVVLLVVALTATLARAVVRPLLGLTRSAHRVARGAELELARIADDESDAPATVRWEPVRVDSQDEIGDLGRAFDRVQETAVRLVERQAAIRRNVALMFGYLGRRTQNLVGRQLALIDQLEQAETDSGRLADLYRLDHVSSRLRRNASSLVVLSGAAGADEHVAPLALDDLVRLALGEIEDYRRVDVDVPAGIELVPSLIGDLVLLLAELMENATAFSPPHTRVSVSARAAGTGVELLVIDRGIGMAPQRLAAENARLARRERLDIAPTEVLGLFVVGRLARRHGLRVTLAATPGGGLTAAVWIDQQLLARTEPVPQVSAPPAPAVAPAVTSWTTIAPAAVPPADLPRAGPRAADPTGSPPPAPERAPDLGLAATPGVEPGLVDLTALGRASRTITTVRPWNAFALPRAARPPVAAAGNLRRRVPGAALRSLGGSAATPNSRNRQAAGPADPARVRELVEQFESGVARALRETSPNDPQQPAGSSEKERDDH